MNRILIAVAGLSILVGISVAAAPGPHAPEAAPDVFDAMRQELLGVLSHARLDVNLEDTPVRDAVSSLAAALEIPILGRWHDDRTGHGMNADVRISLRMRDVSGIEALEMIIDQATIYEPCTWQLRNGFIEVGTHRRLSFPGAVERRSYPINDLLLEPRYSQGPPPAWLPGRQTVDTNRFDRHPYRAASLYDGRWTSRKDAARLGTELIRAIVEVIGPWNWNYADELRGTLPQDARFRTGQTVQQQQSKVASVRRDRSATLVITAPDFMHRGLMGAPKGTFPADLAARLAAEGPHPADEETPIRLVRIDQRPAQSGWRLVAGNSPRAGSGEIWSPDDESVPIVIRLDEFGLRTHERNEDQGGPPVLRGAHTAEEHVARMLGALVYSRIDVSFDRAPAREALRVLGERIGVPIIGRYRDDPIGYGLDPAAPVTIEAGDLSGMQVLEQILEQCSTPGDECLWQMRRGFVEVGPKSRLSAAGARDLRVYDVRDLMHEPTNHTDKRPPPEALALDFVEVVVTMIEPDAWDWGQPLEPPVAEEVVPSSARPVDARQPGDRPEVGPLPPSSPLRRPYVEHVRPAIIRHWRDVIIVYAPDYIHRQIGGYPIPIRPE